MCQFLHVGTKTCWLNSKINGGKELFIIISLMFSFLFRSTSPKSKDTKVKREKDVKMEEEDQEEKKKEKVPPIMEQFISR